MDKSNEILTDNRRGPPNSDPRLRAPHIKWTASLTPSLNFWVVLGLRTCDAEQGLQIKEKLQRFLHRGKPKFFSYIYRKINLHSADISVKRTQTPTCSERALLASKSSAQTPLIMFSDVVLKQRRLFQIDALTECSYLALINRAGGLYGRILTEVVSTDRTQ